MLNAQDQSAGTRFWLGYMESIDLLFNGSPEFGIQVSSAQNGSGTIEVPGTGLEIPFDFSAGTTEVMLPDAIWYSQVTEQVEDKGVLISTDVEVELTAMHYRIYFCDASRILPEDALSNSYAVLAAQDFNSNSPSALVIVSTQDGTEVSITPSVLTQGLHPPGITYTVSLDEGQIYQILASSDLTGTVIEALNGEKLAVFAGAKQADVYCSADDSHLWDQILPESLWGTDYLFIPYQNGGGDVFKVLSSVDGTEIDINCGEETQLLNAGESVSFFRTQVTRLHSNQPVQVAHLSTSSSCNPSDAGPSFVILSPLNRRANNMQWFASDNVNEGVQQIYFTDHFIHVVTETENTSSVTIDGNSVSFTEADTYPGLSYARVAVSAGSHELNSDAPVWAEAFGYSFAEAYTFSMNWDQDVPVSQVDVTAISGPTGSEFCPGEEILFNYSFGIELSEGVWDFGDGSTASGGPTSHEYEFPGEYIVSFTAPDEQGCPYSGYMILVVEDCANSIEEELFSNVSAYIAQNHLHINDVPKGATQFKLYNGIGQLVWQEESPSVNLKIDLNGLSTGVYVLQLSNANTTASYKLYRD